MNRIIFLLILAITICICCSDGTVDCYEEPNRVGAGTCELISVLISSSYNGDVSKIPPYSLNEIVLLCGKQDMDRKRCDNQAEWWPLPKNLNHPSGNENILSISPEK